MRRVSHEAKFPSDLSYLTSGANPEILKGKRAGEDNVSAASSFIELYVFRPIREKAAY